MDLPLDHDHRWWPRPDVGPDAVRCTECGSVVPATKLPNRDKVKAFATHVLRTFFASGHKREEAESYARGQWKVYASMRPELVGLEQVYWETFHQECEVLL